MSEYAQRFAENRIDLSILPDLTDQDLEKLGVLLGDRRKMLRAIAALGSDAGTTPQVPTASQPARQDTAERRQVTLSQQATADSIDNLMFGLRLERAECELLTGNFDTAEQ